MKKLLYALLISLAFGNAVVANPDELLSDLNAQLADLTEETKSEELIEVRKGRIVTAKDKVVDFKNKTVKFIVKDHPYMSIAVATALVAVSARLLIGSRLGRWTDTAEPAKGEEIAGMTKETVDGVDKYFTGDDSNKVEYPDAVKEEKVDDTTKFYKSVPGETTTGDRFFKRYYNATGGYFEDLALRGAKAGAKGIDNKTHRFGWDTDRTERWVKTPANNGYAYAKTHKKKFITGGVVGTAAVVAGVVYLYKHFKANNPELLEAINDSVENGKEVNLDEILAEIGSN